MGLPKAVQEQLDAADEIVKTLGTPPVDEAPAGDTSVPLAEPVAPAPEAPPAPAPQPAPEVAPATKEDFEAKYRALQGKYNAEVPRLASQVRELTQTVQELRVRETPPEPQRTQDAPLVNEKDAENFGSDLMDAVVRTAEVAAKRVAAEVAAQLRSEFAPVQQQVGQVVQKQVAQANDVFWKAVRALVPDWEAIDGQPGMEGTEDPRWVQFLNSTPRFANMSYRQMAAGAIEAGEAEKVAELVALWKATLAPAAPAGAAPNPNRQKLEHQATPSSSKGAPPPAAGAQDIWTAERYNAAFDPRNLRLMGQKKTEQLMAEADRALQEGRIRW